jgi:nucleoside-diphosphate-sugar epimerase
MGLSAPQASQTGGARPGRERVLVLGASGFIGERIVAALAAADWAIPVAASRSGRVPPWPQAEALRVDARDVQGMQAALNGASAVVNCVAGDTDSVSSGARVLFEACARMQVQPRVVHLSTMQVYGSTRGRVDETSPMRGDWDAYGAAKVAAEQISRCAGSVVTLRPGIVYGPGSPIWTLAIGRWLRARRLGDLGPAGDGICNLVHVDDVVRAVMLGLRIPGVAGQAFNLSLPEPPSWNAYFRMYADALGTPVGRISPLQLSLEQWVLAPPLKLAQIAARALRRPCESPAPMRPWFLRLCRQELRLDVGKAERLLGMRWKPLGEGLRESADWLRTHDARSANDG